MKDGSRCVAIIDTKWKRIFDEGDVDQSDIYQMFVYSARYQCQNAILVYPRVSDVSFRYSSDSIDMVLRNFNYNLEKPNLDALLAMVKESSGS